MSTKKYITKIGSSVSMIFGGEMVQFRGYVRDVNNGAVVTVADEKLQRVIELDPRFGTMAVYHHPDNHLAKPAESARRIVEESSFVDGDEGDLGSVDGEASADSVIDFKTAKAFLFENVAEECKNEIVAIKNPNQLKKYAKDNGFVFPNLK